MEDKNKEYYIKAYNKTKNGFKNYPCNNEMNIPETSSLGWLCQNFPFIEEPEDESDKISSCIFMYCYDAIRKIEELAIENEVLKNELKRIEENE